LGELIYRKGHLASLPTQNGQSGVQMISGIGAGLGAIALFARREEVFVLVLTAVLLFVVGLYTYNASRGFSEIVTTVGADITHLMEAVWSLKSLYNIQFWLIMTYLFIIALIVLIIIFGTFFGS
jgi:hypothetical protein